MVAVRVCSPLRRLLLLLLIVPLLAVGPRAQTAVEASTPGAASAANVVLLHINDFHGQFRPLEALWRDRGNEGVAPQMVGGAAVLAGYVQDVRAAAAATGVRVVFTDAGDWFQGTLEGNDSKGRLAVDFLSRLAVDAAVVGNHEYDFGDRNLEQLIAAARFPVLGANILVAGAPTRQTVAYARPWHVVEVHGLRIVIVGLCAAETKKVSTGPFGEVEFEAEAQALAAVLPAARAAGDVVVLLSHCGLEVDRRLASQFPEIPLILGGHSHTALKRPYVEGKTWIVQTQGKTTAVYRIEAIARPREKRLELLRGTLVELDLGQHRADAATQQWVDERTRGLSEKWDGVIGELVTPMVDDRAAHSSAAGNFVCDAILAKVGGDLAFSNKGGIRARLRPGTLTRRSIYELLPFENTLVTAWLRGAQLRALLQASMAPGKKLPDIGGGTYSYRIVDGQRVLAEVAVGGVPLEEERLYAVSTNSFLANGGDAFGTMTEAVRKQDHGVFVRDAVVDTVRGAGKVVVDTRQRIFVVEDGK